MFSLSNKAGFPYGVLRRGTLPKVCFPRVHTGCGAYKNKTEIECAEQKASRSAMVGLISACIGEICFDGHPGITHQLALECHTTTYIAYFLIVFTAAFDVEKMTRYLPYAFDPESYKQKESSFLPENIELICGRMSMILFVFFFLNGIHNHGFAHEVGPLQQIAELCHL